VEGREERDILPVVVKRDCFFSQKKAGGRRKISPSEKMCRKL